MSQLFPEATIRTQAPYRNDIVGSFLRTDALKKPEKISISKKSPVTNCVKSHAKRSKIS